MPRLLLLIPTTSYKAHDFLVAAQRLNVEVVVGSNERQTLEEVVPDHALTLDFQDTAKGVDQAVSFAAKHPLDAVVATDDEAVVLAVCISEALGLRHNPQKAVRATQDKYRLRQALAKAHLPIPHVACFSVHDSIQEIVSRWDTYPAVVKPIHLSASCGVIRVNNAEEFKNGFNRVRKILSSPDLQQRGHRAAAQTILVESFIFGEEVALEGLLQKGRLSTLALFDKPDPLEGPFFEETIYVTPSRLPERIQREMEQAAQQACRAIGLEEGPVHAELRLNEQGIFVIEVAARSIGGLCSRALSFGLGISLEELILQHAFNIPPVSLQRIWPATGVMMIPIPKAGTLLDVKGLDEGRKIKGIQGIVLTMHRNQKVVPLPEGRRYLGFIFARGETPEEVISALRQAHQALTFDITAE